MVKKILIPWSCGVDSTYLVLKACMEGHRVYYCHLDAAQPKNAYQAEAACFEALLPAVLENARKSAKPECEVLHPFQVWSHAKIDFSGTSLPVKQMPAWFMHCLSMVSNSRCEHIYDEVQLGYLLNDDAAASTPYLVAAWDVMCKAVYGLDFEPPKLMFPLLRYRKGQVIESLRAAKILHLTQYCELPQRYDDGWKPCDVCPSCIRHKNGVLEGDTGSEFNRKFRDLICDYDHRATDTQHTPTENEEVKVCSL